MSCMLCKTFLRAYNTAKNYKNRWRISASYDHKCTATFFMVHSADLSLLTFRLTCLPNIMSHYHVVQHPSSYFCKDMLLLLMFVYNNNNNNNNSIGEWVHDTAEWCQEGTKWNKIITQVSDSDRY